MEALVRGGPPMISRETFCPYHPVDKPPSSETIIMPASPFVSPLFQRRTVWLGEERAALRRSACRYSDRLAVNSLIARQFLAGAIDRPPAYAYRSKKKSRAALLRLIHHKGMNAAQA